MLFFNFSSDNYNTFKSKLHEVAKDYKGDNIKFLIGDLDASEMALKVIPFSFFFLFSLSYLGFHLFHGILNKYFACGKNLQFFGLEKDQAPLIIIQDSKGHKYFQPNVTPEQIATWLKDYAVCSLSIIVSCFLVM